ncbi:hypothetical protein ACFZDG_05235 [Kitasatospora xanthocidica]|uniref:hypothetical protein n=1 Tax=Kitasatospora xanthocidica TaxID=83382 RepID=UPI0036E0193F
MLRPLLLAALLLGVLTMHTLGHPAGAHGGDGGRGGHPTAQRVTGSEHRLMGDEGHAPGSGLASVVSGSASVDAASVGGMDPMTVCLAVLAGWTLVLLVAGPLRRRSGDAAAELRARLLRAVRALPPPGGGRTLLTRLSVLRQ